MRRSKLSAEWQLLHPGAVGSQHVEGVGIDYDGTLGTSDLRDHGDGRLFALAQSGTDAQGLVVVGIDNLREQDLVVGTQYHSLGDTGLQDGDVALGRAHRHLAGTGAQTGPGGQDGGTGHAVAAGDEQGVAHGTLMGKGRPRLEA